MPDDLPFVPDATLDLVDAGWWLELRCACERMTQVPHKLLVKAHGRLSRVPHLLARMRCSQCERGTVEQERGAARVQEAEAARDAAKAELAEWTAGGPLARAWRALAYRRGR